LPDKESRKKILEINIKDIPADVDPQSPDCINVEKIAEMTDGMSGADVAAISNTAVSLVIHEFLDNHPDVKEAEKAAEKAKITMKHFEEGVKKVRDQKDLKLGQKVVASYYRSHLTTGSFNKIANLIHLNVRI